MISNCPVYVTEQEKTRNIFQRLRHRKNWFQKAKHLGMFSLLNRNKRPHSKTKLGLWPKTAEQEEILDTIEFMEEILVKEKPVYSITGNRFFLQRTKRRFRYQNMFASTCLFHRLSLNLYLGLIIRNIVCVCTYIVCLTKPNSKFFPTSGKGFSKERVLWVYECTQSEDLIL